MYSGNLQLSRYFLPSSESHGNSTSAGSPGLAGAFVMNWKSLMEAGMLIFLSGTLYAQIQVGPDLVGEALEDNFGYAVSLSEDGSRLAVGGLNNNGNGNNSGHVRVFQWTGNSWGKLGADIDGEAARDIFGASVSLSADGTRLAVGAPQNDGNGVDSGQVRVFDWSGTAWTQTGADIDGEAADDRHGFSVSLSADGNLLAVGAALNDGNGRNAGHVRVYQWSGSAWTQYGGDIDGEASGDQSGIVSMSANGKRLAVGAIYNDGNGIDSGHARVYTFSTVQNPVALNGPAATGRTGGYGLQPAALSVGAAS
jgi:hypothetical protein